MTFDEWCLTVQAHGFAFRWTPSMVGPTIPIIRAETVMDVGALQGQAVPGDAVAAGRWTYWLEASRGVIDDDGSVECVVFRVGHSDPEEALRMASRLEVELP